MMTSFRLVMPPKMKNSANTKGCRRCAFIWPVVTVALGPAALMLFSVTVSAWPAGRAGWCRFAATALFARSRRNRAALAAAKAYLYDQGRRQPPQSIAMSSAPRPAISTRAPGRTGSTPPLFLSRTNDLPTASRATAKLAGVPMRDTSTRATGCVSSRASANFTRKIRRTASSTRVIGIVPRWTWRNVDLNIPFQLSGAITRSSPALKVSAQSVPVQPGNWP